MAQLGGLRWCGGLVQSLARTVSVVCGGSKKGKDAIVLEWSLSGVLISLSQAIEPVGYNWCTLTKGIEGKGKRRFV